VTAHNPRWAQVSDFPAYEVSTDGRIRSCDRTVGGGKFGSYPRMQRGRELTPSLTGTRRYPTVTLYAGGQSRRVTIHVLVLETFVGPRPPGHEGRHKDNNPANCSIDNLYWGRPGSSVPVAAPTDGVPERAGHEEDAADDGEDDADGGEDADAE
jgi:hypothetical protein